MQGLQWLSATANRNTCLQYHVHLQDEGGLSHYFAAADTAPLGRQHVPQHMWLGCSHSGDNHDSNNVLVQMHASASI